MKEELKNKISEVINNNNIDINDVYNEIDKYIENELRARLDFKGYELTTGIKNIAKTNWGLAYSNNSQKHAYYWEAFEQLEGMVHKEMKMPTPYDDMSERRRKIKLNEAKEDIMGRFCKRGERDYHHKEQILVSILTKAQDY